MVYFAMIKNLTFENLHSTALQVNLVEKLSDQTNFPLRGKFSGINQSDIIRPLNLMTFHFIKFVILYNPGCRVWHCRTQYFKTFSQRCT